MKKNYLATAMICLTLASLFTGPGCKRYEHKKEEKIIRRERAEVGKSTSDLNEAVVITDLAGWDSAKDYRQFVDTSVRRINACNTNILHVKQKIKKEYQKIPKSYERKFTKLERKSHELEERLGRYTIKNKSEWEDFTKLFNYDLQQLELAVKKLNSY
jgi:hypothetical protein